MDSSPPIKLDLNTIRRLQLKQLDMLKYFKSFCDEHGLLFYFCGGCCIGTLRNKGFIPWDDDIDVFMPRDDYEKLPKLWKKYSKAPRFLCLKTNDEIFTGNIFTTIVDTSSTCVKTNQVNIDVPHGLVMDVFPLDGCPKGFKRKMQKIWAMVYGLFLSEVVPQNHGAVMRLGGKVLLGVFHSRKLRTKIWRFAEKKMSQYKIDDCDCITELCAGPKYMGLEYPKEIFESACLKEFEGMMMPIPAGYDNYLKMAFGDYMKLPPKNCRVPHHDLAYLDLDTPCRVYDGKNNKTVYSTKTD